MNTVTGLVVGIDVAKDELVSFHWQSKQSETLSNTPEAIRDARRRALAESIALLIADPGLRVVPRSSDAGASRGASNPPVRRRSSPNSTA